MNTILYTVIVALSIAFILGILLGLFKKIFHVNVDPKVESVREVLSGANCGGCGMAAITALFDTFEPGTHIICSDDLYGGTERLFNTIGKKLGFKTTYTDTSDLKNIENATTSDTKIIYIETPGNPLMKITDIKKTAEYAHAHRMILIVDNTFLTPYLQQPLSLGADVVVQSGTKYCSAQGELGQIYKS